MEAVQKNVATAIKVSKVNLDDPANTLLLLKANAVVGVTGSSIKTESRSNQSESSARCATRRSTNRGIEQPSRWLASNRDLNIGAIVALAPDLSAFAKSLQVEEIDGELCIRVERHHPR
jgi:hypothetical protein